MPSADKKIDFNRLALDTAELSPARKRKVGAVVVFGKYYATGYNYNPQASYCENDKGETLPEVIHAEVVALQAYIKQHLGLPKPNIIYVTQPPCAACQKILQEAGVTEIRVVETFMKFDSGKLRYELIPPSVTHALASVLTYGARKYKPNNWKKGEVDRYVGAAMRHFEAYRAGEYYDEESGLPHLQMLLTNAAFLVELDPPKNHPKA